MVTRMYAYGSGLQSSVIKSFIAARLSLCMVARMYASGPDLHSIVCDLQNRKKKVISGLFSMNSEFQLFVAVIIAIV